MADLQTKLSYFLTDLWAGTMGVLHTITTLVTTTSVTTPTYNLSGATGETLAIKSVTEALPTTGGALTQDTATTIIPANSLVFGVTVRVTTIIAGGAIATFGVGTAGDTDAWGATTAVAVAAGSTNSITNFVVTTPIYYAAATKVRLTANAGTFTSGAVRVCVHYLTLAAPTS